MSTPRLPKPVSEQDTLTDRQFRTMLPIPYYRKFDLLTIECGSTPFKFTSILLQLYIDGKLIDISDFPETTQQAIIKSIDEKKRQLSIPP